MAALKTSGQTKIIENNITRDHTEILFKYLGVDLKKKLYKNGKTKLKILGPVEIKAKKIYVASDPSSAAFFTALTLLNKKSSIKIKALVSLPVP